MPENNVAEPQSQSPHLSDNNKRGVQTQKLLKQKLYDRALSSALNEVRQYPQDREALYLVVVCQRYCQQYALALKSSETLITHYGDYGRAFQERGHIFTSLDDYSNAALNFRQAVELNSALPASWKGLAISLKHTQQDSEAQEALAQFKYLENQAPELVSIASMRNEGRLYKAESLCRDFLQRHPHQPEAMRLLALIGLDTGVFDDAEFLLDSCLELYPDFDQARLDYANVLHRRQKFAQANQQTLLLIKKLENNHSIMAAHANSCVAIGKNAEALKLYDKLLLDNPNLAGIHLARGHALKTAGDAEAAIENYRNAYKARQDFGDAYWSLANMKTYRFTEREFATMERNGDSPTTSYKDRFHLYFAQAKGFEDEKDFSKAIDLYHRGNELKRKSTKYSKSKNTEETDLLIKHFSRSKIENRASGCACTDPIFIVGLPRSGSTLLEQILASHSQVDGTLELPNIPAIAYRLGGRRELNQKSLYPKKLMELPDKECEQLGEKYLAETRVHRGKAPFFIDKMPNNFRHIGLIHRILPNAKIIDARRHPMACCFSGYKQLFAEGQEFSYSLDDIAHYYRDYVRLMKHWDSTLPSKVLRVHYEDVVSDLEVQVKRILKFCELEFEETCLEFHKTLRSVRTASSEQVRQPLYSQGIDQWKNFSKYLKPLQDTLKDIIEEYPKMTISN